MGDLNVTKLKTKKDRANYIHHLLNDIKALDVMIEKGLIEEGPLWQKSAMYITNKGKKKSSL